MDLFNSPNDLMSTSLFRMGIVSLATVLSRILGLVRDVLTFAIFGTGALHSAFQFAYTLPNLFRRLLGEGALTAALIPVFSEEVEEKGRDGSWPLFNQVLCWLFLTASVLVVLGWLFFAVLPFWFDLSERWLKGVYLARILFPYLLFICLAAMFAAALNVLHRFAVPALSAVWLNASIILFLGLGAWLFVEGEEQRMHFLCAGVLFGGFLQCLIPAWALRREGWRPRWQFEFSSRLREILVLMLPGLAGTAIFQVNVIVSRSLAFSLDAEAVSILYLANRLVELPLGVFAIAVSTVIFPLLSQASARGDVPSQKKSFLLGLRMNMLLTLPATAGLIALHEPILIALFQWGVFGADEVSSTRPVIVVFALSIPFYAWATFTTRAFYSLKNTRTPVKVAALAFLINLGLSLLLMRILGVVGLALANVLSSAAHALLLQILLGSGNSFFRFKPVLPDCLKTSSAAILMGLLVGFGWFQWKLAFGDGKLSAVILLAIGIIAGAMVFGLLVWILRIHGRAELVRLLGNKWRVF